MTISNTKITITHVNDVPYPMSTQKNKSAFVENKKWLKKPQT